MLKHFLLNYTVYLHFIFVKYIKVFGEGNDANYLLKAFKHTIHRRGLPDGLLSKAETKVFVGFDDHHGRVIGKYKDFRFYYEVN